MVHRETQGRVTQKEWPVGQANRLQERGDISLRDHLVAFHMGPRHRRFTADGMEGKTRNGHDGQYLVAKSYLEFLTREAAESVGQGLDRQSGQDIGELCGYPAIVLVEPRWLTGFAETYGRLHRQGSFPLRQQMKLPCVKTTSILWLCLWVVILLPVAIPAASAEGGYKLPKFRKVQTEAKMPAFPQGMTIRLAADADFPPYSFQARSGVPAGLSVELALAACAEIKVKCEVMLKPLSQLLRGLASKEHDVVVSGPRIDEVAVAHAVITRPWFRSFGRFAAQTGNPGKGSDARNLAGRRIGAVAGTAHAAWLATYYADAELLTFDSDLQAQEALRTGAIDALFADNLRLIYWITGSASRGCCKIFGGAYSDFETFSRNVAFLVRGDRADIRDAFDVALDRLQANGTTEKLFNTYVPLNPW